MPVTVVVGGQYGGEGKGKTVAFLSRLLHPEVVVRCGGPNSGHTVLAGATPVALRMIPAGYVNRGSRLLLAPGSLIEPQLLLDEASLLGIGPEQLGIDFRATVIETQDCEKETTLQLRQRLGSTLSGVGATVARRALRDPDLQHARDIDSLRPFLCDVADESQRVLEDNGRVIIEGTQGFGLSLLHGGHYPYATSRDTTAAAFVSEVGVGPSSVDEVLMVVRTFPIRVEGNSGPLNSETNWEVIRSECGAPHSIEELTTVTRRPRRVGRFDMDLVVSAARYNGATGIVVNGLDLIDYGNRAVRHPSSLTAQAVAFLKQLERRIPRPVLLAGVGPHVREFVVWNWDSREIRDATSVEAR